MRWFRLHQKWGTCFALAALMIQLAVCSGHVHFDLTDHDHRHIEYAGALADAHGGSAAAAHEHGHDDDSSGSPHAPDQNHCAACALIHLANSLLTASALILPLPVAFDRPALVAASAALTEPHSALFQARAPPFA